MGGDRGQTPNPPQRYLRAVSAFHPSAWALARFLRTEGVDAWISSPGSRHAPLVEAFHGCAFPHHAVLLDERAAAHFALGAAEAQGKPAVVVCTSGSASLNLAPAVVEAFYRELPLVVLTADRPSAHIDQGQGQSIRQGSIFGDHVVAQFTLEEDDSNAPPEQQKTLLERNAARWTAAWTAAHQHRGPVHLNVPLREPLYGYNGAQNDPVIPADLAFPEAFGGAPRNNPPVHHRFPGPHDADGWNRAWWQAERRAVWVGQMPLAVGRRWNAMLQDWLRNDPALVVVAEPLSNLGDGPWVSWEQHLAAGTAEALLPQAIATVGGALVSKRWKNELRAARPWHVHLGATVRVPDVVGHLQAHCPLGPEALDGLRWWEDASGASSASEALSATQNGTEWARRVRQAEEAAQRRITAWEDHCIQDARTAGILTDAAAVALWMRSPNGVQRLSVANSASVRYALRSSAVHRSLWNAEWQANRGTAGIDGSSSTALGAAWADGKPTALLTGELSFFYDANAWFHPHLPNNFVAVVLNNRGGSIFRLIDGPSQTGRLAEDFEAQHTRSVLPWAREMGCNTHTASTVEAWENLLASGVLFSNEHPVVVELITHPEQSEIHWKSLAL